MTNKGFYFVIVPQAGLEYTRIKHHIDYQDFTLF